MTDGRPLEDSAGWSSTEAIDESLSTISRQGDLALIRTLTSESALAPDSTITLDEDSGETAWLREGPEHARAELRRPVTLLAIGQGAGDATSLVASLVLGDYLLNGSFLQSPILMLGAVGLWIGVFYGFGLYATQHLSPSDEFRRVISATSLGLILTIVAVYWSGPHLPRTWLALIWVLTLVAELFSRRCWRWMTWRLRKNAKLALQTLIIGTNGEAEALRRILDATGSGYTPVGFVTTADAHPGRFDGLPCRTLPSLDEGTLRDIDCLFVASTSIGLEEMLAVVKMARRHDVELRISANVPQLLTSRLTVQQIGRVMVLSLRPVRLTKTRSAVKRACDIVGSTIILLLALPVLAIVAILVRFTSRGPVLFRQQRVTAGGRTFTMVKFRTMVQDADDRLKTQQMDTRTPFFKVQSDSFLTPVGRFLRRWSLDELPQLFNVVKGDMSLVGPRPLPAPQVAANLDLLAARHEVKAGLTGWWQIQGRSDLDVEESVRLDLFYIENWSLGLDLFILLKTLGVLIARRGAY
jgi:exopolysaccharide biosynthesis polyprenyl glycosylphosphotransferase